MDPVTATANRAALELARTYSEGTLVRRDAHAKAHDRVRTKLAVSPDIATDRRIGLFAFPDSERRAWARFWNNAFTPGDDRGRAGRDMALKNIEAMPDGQAQDILMINHPTCSSGAMDYCDSADASVLAGDTRGLRRYVIPRLKRVQLAITAGADRLSDGQRAARFAANHTLLLDGPFAFGPDRKDKYSASPCGANSSAPEADRGPDFLSRKLSRALAGHDACFDLTVQPRKGSMPVDNVTAELPEAEAPFCVPGRVDLMRQAIDSPARHAYCEAMAFNTWNGPEAHAPRGS